MIPAMAATTLACAVVYRRYKRVASSFVAASMRLATPSYVSSPSEASGVLSRSSNHTVTMARTTRAAFVANQANPVSDACSGDM